MLLFPPQGKMSIGTKGEVPRSYPLGVGASLVHVCS